MIINGNDVFSRYDNELIDKGNLKLKTDKILSNITGINTNDLKELIVFDKYEDIADMENIPINQVFSIFIIKSQI